MAPKAKSRLVDQPPSASSSEEQQEQVEESQEEEEQSEEEEEEESGEETEEDEPKTAPPVDKKLTTQKPVQTTPQKPQSSSESGTENGSGSESESEAESGQSQPSPSASDFTVKPIVPAKSTPSKPPAKRPQETQQTQKERDSRKKKPKIAEEEEKKSAAATPRSLWSDEDQVALLKGIAEYKAQKGTEPNADMTAFHEFIKGKLQADVSKSQLSDKLRRLKKKFLTNVKDGEDPVFSKGQDYLVFEYSKKIWGAPVSAKGDGETSNGVKENVSNSTNAKAKKNVAVKKSAEPKKSGKVTTFTKPKDDEKHKEEEKEKQVAVKEVVKEDIVKGGDKQDFKSRYPRLAASFESMGDMSTMYPNATSYLKENMNLIASDKAKVLEEKWKKLQDDEAALMAKRLDLIAEHYRLVVDAMKGN